jgi:fatty-acyl-CoA synthase
MDGGIADWVARRALRRPDATALVDVATGARHTYADLDRRVGARAAALAALGVDAGDRVALLGENSAAYLEWLFGAARLGAVTVPVNHRLAPAEVAHVLADSGARVLVRSAAFAALAEDALAAVTDGGGTDDRSARWSTSGRNPATSRSPRAPSPATTPA